MKIVVLRASRIGDYVCATPAFRAIKRKHPDCELTLIGLPVVRALAQRCSYLDRFERFPGYPGLADQFFDPARVLGFLGEMQERRFDIALQMHGSGVFSNPLAMMIGAKKTAVFVRPSELAWAQAMGLRAVVWDERTHEILRTLALLQTIGIPAAGLFPEVHLWPEDRVRAEQLVAGLRGPLIGLQPGARTRSKRWPVRHFAWVARELGRVTGGSLVLLGGDEEKADCRTIADAVGFGCRVLAGQLDLPVMGALIERLSLFVTNDSGPAHMAYALQVPSVVVFGGTDPAEWGPACEGPFTTLVAKVDCRPCDRNECERGWRCLEEVSREDVLEAALATYQSSFSECTCRKPAARRPARRT